MSMCINDNYPRNNILLNVYVYNVFVKIGGNENNEKFSKQRGKLPYFVKIRVITR